MQLVHWIPFVPAVMLAAHIFTHVEALQAGVLVARSFHMSQLQVPSLMRVPFFKTPSACHAASACRRVLER